MKFEPSIISLAPTGLCKQTYNPKQCPIKDIKEENSSITAEHRDVQESPIKKRLRARKEAARMQQLAIEGNFGLSKDKSCVKDSEEKIMTDTCYNDSKKKVHQLVDNEKTEVACQKYIKPDKEQIGSIVLNNS